MSSKAPNYRVTNEEVDGEGNKTIYIESRGRGHNYVVPDYLSSKEAYEKHQSKTNWIGLLTIMFMFLSLLGLFTSSWVTVVERVTKTETFQSINLESSASAIELLDKRVEANTNNVMQDYYHFDGRFKLMMEAHGHLSHQLDRIETSVRSLVENHTNVKDHKK